MYLFQGSKERVNHVINIQLWNEKFFELEWDIIIGIGEKVQETSPVTGMHVVVPSPYYSASSVIRPPWGREWFG